MAGFIINAEDGEDDDFISCDTSEFYYIIVLKSYLKTESEIFKDSYVHVGIRRTNKLYIKCILLRRNGLFNTILDASLRRHW